MWFEHHMSNVYGRNPRKKPKSETFALVSCAQLRIFKLQSNNYIIQLVVIQKETGPCNSFPQYIALNGIYCTGGYVGH